MKKILILIFLLFVSPNIFAKINIKIIGPSYPGLIEPNGSGEHQRQIKIALQGSEFEISEQILPAKRALYSFIEKDSDCIYSMSKQVRKNLTKHSSILNSKSVNNLRLYIFTKKGKNPIISISELDKNKSIGGVLGNEDVYNEVVGDNQKIEYVIQDEQNLSKLRKNRIAYIFGYLPQLNPYTDELSYKEDKPLTEIPDSIVCYQNEQTTKFIETLNKNLTLKAGEIKKSHLETFKKKKIERSILLLNELLVDILPPPLYIIDIHLSTLQIIVDITNKTSEHQALVNYLKNAKELYEVPRNFYMQETFQTRLNYWRSYKGFAEIQNLFNIYQKEALVYAEKYFSIQQGSFKEAIYNKKYSDALEIYNNQLIPLYNKHRKEIDSLTSKILYEKSKAENNLTLTNQFNSFLMDILPPPSYIVEPFAVAHRILFAWSHKNAENINSLTISHTILEGAELSDSNSFKATLEKWNSIFNNQLKEEKEIYKKFKETQKPAQLYFKKVNPSLKLISAKEFSIKEASQLNNSIDEYFNIHRKSIFSLVLDIRKRIEILERKSP